MTTVGSLAYSISANTSNFTAGMVATKAELRDLKSAFLAGQEPVEKYSAAIAHLESLAVKFPDKAAGIQSTIAKMRTEMNKAADGGSMLSGVMGRMGIVMDPVSAAFKVFDLAVGAARMGLDAFESLVSKVGDSMERLDELAKTSRNLGIDPSQLVGLRRAAEDISGVDAGTFDKAFTKFGGNIGNAAMTGKGPASDALKRLGLDAAELSAKSTADQLLTVADALAQVENAGERLALSKSLLGKGGEELATMLAAGGDAIRALADDQNTLAQTKFLDLDSIEAANDSIGRVGTLLQGLVDIIASDFAPLVKDVADGLVTAFGDATNKGESFRDVVQGVALVMREVGNELTALFALFNTPAGQAILSYATGGASGIIGSTLGSIQESGSIANEGRTFGGQGGASQAAIDADKNQKAIDAAAKAESDFHAMEIEHQLGLANAVEFANAKKAKEVKDIGDAFEKMIDAVNKEIAAKGEQIAESLKTPAEKLRDDFEELQDSFRLGAIDDATFQRGLEALRSKARDMSLTDSGPRSVGALRAGSAEALRQEFSGKATTEKQLEEAKKTAENTQKAADLLQDIKDALADPTLQEAT